MLANPQDRLFSPTMLLDVLLPAHVANVFSLVIFGGIGIWGMFTVLRHRGLDYWVSIAGGFLFINSSFFGLHFTEGHIAFETMQLLPWAFYFGLRISEIKYQFRSASLLALITLNGGIYAFSFSLFLIGCAFICNHAKVRMKLDPAFTAGFIFMFACLVAIRLVPALLLISHRQPSLMPTSLPLGFLFQILFNPAQHLMKVIPAGIPWGFHEYGCYVGVVAAGLLVYSMASAKFRKDTVLLTALMLFWLWVASGWGGTFNPWRLYEKLPLFNNVRLQSRLFILFHFFLILLVAEALRSIADRRWRIGIIFFLVAESFLVKNYAFLKGFQTIPVEVTANRVIQSRTIEQTLQDTVVPFHYFRFPDTGSVGSSNDPGAPPTTVSCSDCPDYKGEAYFLQGKGEARLQEYTPAGLKVSFNGVTPGIVQINTNQLLGWRIEKGPAELLHSQNRLLTFITLTPTGIVHLVYRPSYLLPCVGLYMGGIVLFLFFTVKLEKTSKTGF